jgi:hypothetical protein
MVADVKVERPVHRRRWRLVRTIKHRQMLTAVVIDVDCAEAMHRSPNGTRWSRLISAVRRAEYSMT